MADKIRGITIEIGGDTSDLTKALKSVNSEVSNTQKQLKDVEKLLKLDPGNTELLKQKQQLLNQEVEQTNRKLDELKKIQDTMDQNGVDKNSEQYQALRREIINTESSLKKVEEAANSSSAALAKVSATADKVGTAAQKVADKTKALSTAAGATVAAVGALAYSAVTASDDLNTLSKQTGINTSDLQKMQYAADLIDVSVEDITGSLRKMKKNMTSTSTDTVAAFKTLGVSVTDTSGQLRDSTTVFYEVIESLSHVYNETERDALAMQIFGKSADSLAGIVDDGGAALRAFGDEFERLGLIMDQQTLDSLNEVNDQIDTLKAQAKATLAQFGAKALEALMPALNSILNAVAGVLQLIASLNPETIKLVATILAVVACLSPLASGIAAVATAISAVSAAVSFLMANPYVILIMAVVAAVAALAAAVKLLIDNWDEVKLGWSMIFEDMRTDVDNFVNYIGEAFKAAINAVVNAIKSIINAVLQAIENGVNRAIASINRVIEGFNAVVKAVAAAVGITTSGIRTIKNITIPKLAKGGILSSGTALVGEAGPELLTMMGNKAMVQPLTATLDPSSVSALGAGSGNNLATNVSISFEGSLSQLAAVLQPAIKAETTRRGISLINA